MAATSFRALILVLYFSAIRLGTRSYSGLIHFTTYDSYHCDSWTFVRPYWVDFEELFISSRSPVAFARLLCTGLCRTRVPVFKWTKHGYVSIMVPGFDPPLDVAVCGDVLKNPGPVILDSRKLHSEARRSNLVLHMNNTVTTSYSSAHLLNIRRSSVCVLDLSIASLLKSYGILRYRGCRAGHQKIPVRISYRPDKAHSDKKLVSRSLVDIPIVSVRQHHTVHNLKFCCLNARSLRNKSAEFVCYVGPSSADIVAITETWLTADDTAHRIAATPPGYKLLDCPRFDRAGGGTALLVRDNIFVIKSDAGEQKSFEFSGWILKHGSHKLRVIVIYRPPYLSNHPVTSNVFFDEF